MSEVVTLLPWNSTSYETALASQEQFSRGGRHGWLFFCCPPTVTLGRRAVKSDVLVDEAQMSALGVRALAVDRGGEVTYHGPGQIIGFPFGSLETHTGDSRGVRVFMRKLKQALESFVEHELVELGDETRKIELSGGSDCAGVWILERGRRRKLVSIGLSFSKESIRHGFALNVQPLDEPFGWIRPCGENSDSMTSLYARSVTDNEIEAVRGQLGAIFEKL